MWRYSDLFDINTNADIGVQVFKYYLELYKHLIPTLSAYNSDHPGAARGYARAVLSARKRIKRRYTELYKAFRSVRRPHMMSYPGRTPELGSLREPWIPACAEMANRRNDSSAICTRHGPIPERYACQSISKEKKPA